MIHNIYLDSSATMPMELEAHMLRKAKQLLRDPQLFSVDVEVHPLGVRRATGGLLISKAYEHAHQTSADRGVVVTDGRGIFPRPANPYLWFFLITPDGRTDGIPPECWCLQVD